jgi:(p)ppGpp synthase/HD superfamily hydrolase
MNLERAIQIAVKAHAGAKDRGGKAYILHPISVMMQCETDEEKIVAILHDVVEDTD